MNIHEYQAKEILKKYGVAVQGGFVAETQEQAIEAAQKVKEEFQSDWCVVKAQIHAGGRGKGKIQGTEQRGVQVAKNPEMAGDIAKNMLGGTLVTIQTGAAGKVVNKVLVAQDVFYPGASEPKEYYMSVLLDRTKKQNVIIYTTEGGMDIEEVAETHPEKIHREWVSPTTGLQPFQARKIAFNLGLEGKAFKEMVAFVSALYRAYEETDSAMFEINPVLKTSDDRIIAVDAKVNLDDNALYRHKDFLELRDLAEEDPTFRVNTDEETGQTIISGMGELHLEIIVDRLKREFKVEVNQGAPQVSYRENITAGVDHREVYKKQSGGRGKFADIVVKISPQDDAEKSGLEFVNSIKGGNIPREFIPSVEKGFKESMKNGVLAGFPVDAMKVELIDGSFHAVDSDSLSFELCAKMAYKAALKNARPVLLEPIMKMEVVTPEENMGDIVGDLNRRRGVIRGMDDRAGSKVVKADVPLSEMFGYVTQLRTLSSGRASSSMEFSHYAEAPKNVADDVVSKINGKVSA